MVKLYEEWIDPEKVLELGVEDHDIDFYEHLAGEIRVIIRHLRKLPNQLKLLDFGMGWGQWCLMARAYGCSAFGTELSQTRVDHAKASGTLAIRWEQIPEHQFDFINTEQVFEHLADPVGTLRYLANSLNSNGIIKISVPNGRDIHRRLAVMDWTAPKRSKNSLNCVAPLEHINCFTHNSLIRMAEVAGLAPVRIRARPSLNRSLLNYTLREVIRPYYHRLTESTYLFFQRSTEEHPL
jgi:2-polyprenyl-3-methyl-5-hydroxy-6-metoxy-1,4-benzoquinol methylase